MAVTNGQLKLAWRTRSRGPDGPRFAEFFAGIGLVRMGLEARGWKLAYANDLDPDKWAMYDAHFEDADEHFVLDDVHSVDGSTLPDVELATASFPCTDLSLAGARLGFKGEHSSAFWGFVSALVGRERTCLKVIQGRFEASKACGAERVQELSWLSNA